MTDPSENPKGNPKGEPTGEKESWVKGVGLFGVITGELLGASFVGIGTGYLLWKKVGLPWWSLLVCSLVGLGVAFYRLYLISQRNL